MRGVGAHLVGCPDRQHQLFQIVRELEDGMPVVVHQPHILILVVRVDVNRVRPAQHAVPFRPGLLDLPLGVHADDAMLPAPVHIFRPVVRTIERSWWAGGRGVAPRQAADRKPEAGPELREVNFFRPFDVRQFAALEDEDAIGVLGENAFPRSPVPLFVPRQGRQRLRPIRVHVIGPEHVLHALLSWHGCK